MRTWSVFVASQAGAEKNLMSSMEGPSRSCPRIPTADLERVCMIGVGRNGTTVWQAKYVGPGASGLDRTGDVGMIPYDPLRLICGITNSAVSALQAPSGWLRVPRPPLTPLPTPPSAKP